MDLSDCLRKRIIKRIQPDLPLACSLHAAAEKKRATTKMLPINDTTAASVIVLSYDALREHLEALAIMHGIKVNNHDCYRAFLAEHLREPTLARRFDAIRTLRNAINYDGQAVTPAQAAFIKKETEGLIKACLNHRPTIPNP